ncbi:MAG: glycosyltransferase family 4 protein [Acidimicrobiia bacterium]|nr:glycosyltransferase family 4 protein [Acidimicrobiia bacterium]
MRIALTHAYSWPEVRRGAERMIPEMARAFAQRGHDVTVLTSTWTPLTENRLYKVVRIRRRHRDDARHETDFARRLFPHLVAGQFDAVHSLGPRDARSSILASRVRRSRRTVYTNLGLPDRKWISAQPWARAHDRIVRDINAYGCMSQYALDMLERDYGRTGVFTPGGVNHDEFKPAAEREPAPTLLFSGAIGERRKGVSLLLEALPLVAKREPDVRLWLSGQGNAQQWLDEASAEARARTEVLSLGEEDGQAERYGRAWATALPSTNDSFGMALLESLACGTPIVASTHAAPHELVGEGTGAVCAPDSAASVAEACLDAIELARDPATVERCRASTLPYDWDTGLAPAFERIYAGD